jgi:hypothetical protein
VRGLDSLEPAAVFEMFAYRYASGMHHVAANVHRFNGPQSPEMFWLATLP